MERTAALTAYARRRLAAIDGLELQGGSEPQSGAAPTGVLSFALRQQPSAAVAAVLDAEFGIGVPHSRGALPDGLCLRLGLHNSPADIDALADALQKIACGEFDGVYTHDSASGDYVALGGPPRPRWRVAGGA